MRSNCVFKPTAEEVARIIRTPSRGGGLTRRWVTSMISLKVVGIMILAGASEASMPMQLQCEILTETQAAQLASSLVEARRLVGPDHGAVLDGASLDGAWRAWRASLLRDNAGVSKAIEAFGAAFGEILVRDQGFEWLHCKDDFGSGLAVVALRGAGDITIFPSDFVAKRHERGEGPFFVKALVQVRGSVDKVRAEWGAGQVPN